jgi:sec-independent protein translocase protein TatB
MFDIGFGEMIVIAAIALIAIGPKQLPEVARTIGRLLNELRRATGDLTKNFTDARTYVDDVKADVVPPQVHHEKGPEHHPVPGATAHDGVKEEQLAFSISESDSKKGV